MESLGTWIIGLIVGLIIGFAVFNIYKDRKNGKGCGCGCDGCSACPENEHKQS